MHWCSVLLAKNMPNWQDGFQQQDEGHMAQSSLNQLQDLQTYELSK